MGAKIFDLLLAFAIGGMVMKAFVVYSFPECIDNRLFHFAVKEECREMIGGGLYRER